MNCKAIVFLAALCLSFPALPAEDAAKKTGDGFGNLLRGMGQEIKKGTDSAAPKSGKKKEEKK